MKNFNELKLKLKLNKKLLEKYDDNYLNDLEKTIYNSISEDEIIKYEFTNVILKEKDINYNSTFIYRSLLNELINLMENEKENKETIKKLISTLQILANENYAFYDSVKDFDEEYYNYLSEILDRSDDFYKRR